jgi:hypothetical protein
MTSKKMYLPEDFKKYFWDCDFSKLSFKKYKFFITERILNLGNEKSLKWLLKQVDKSFIKEIVNKSRNLDKKTKNFWKIILNEN